MHDDSGTAGEKNTRFPVLGFLNLVMYLFAGKGFLRPWNARLFHLFSACSFQSLPLQTEDSPLRYLAPRVLVFAALFLLAGGRHGMGQEAGQDLPTVAVLDFTGLMIGEGVNSAPLGKAIAAMLVTELSDRDGIRVIERYHLQDLLMEQRLSLSGRVEEDTALEVGLMVGAQYTIYGQVTSIGGTTRMDMRIVNVETTEVMEVEKLSDETSELLSMVVRMADMFSEKLQLEPPSAREEVVAIPVQATIAFSRGVDFEDRGETERAIEQYRRALEIHPAHRDAQKALERLLGEGGDQ